MKNDFRTIVGEVKLSTVQTFDVDLHNKVDKIEDNIEVIDNSIGELYDRSAVLDSSIAKLFDEQKDYATSAMLDNYYTKGQDDSRYNNILTELENKQPKGDYALKGDIPSLYGYATENWVEDKKYLTKVPAEYVTETELEGKGYLTEHQSLNNYAKIANVDASLNMKADKTSIPTKVSAFTNDAGYLTEHQSLTDYAKKTDIPVIPTKLSAFTNDEGFIKNTVTDLVNYYKKSETYTQDEVNELISKIPKFAITVVDELPTSEISLTTVYLVKTSETADNMYTEYIYVNNVWEKLGEQKVDLTDYYTKNQIDNFLNEKADKTEIPDMKPYAKISDVDASLAKYASADSFNALNTEVLKKANKSYVDETFQVKGDYITEIPAEYVTETELEGKGYLTEHQSLTDYAKTADVNNELAKKQDTLVTGTNIKRLSSLSPRSLLGSGNIYIPTINGYDMLQTFPNNYYVKTINKQSVFGNSIGNIDVQPTLVSGTNIKTVNGSSLLGSGNLSVSVDELEADKVKFITKGEEVFKQGEEITNGGNYEHVQYMIFTNGGYGEGLTLSWDGGYSIHYSAFDKNVTFTNIEGTYEKYGEREYTDDLIVKLNAAIPLNNVSISYDSAMSQGDTHAYIATLEQEVKVETLSEVITNYYTKTKIDNMVGDINNALNGLSFWKGTQAEYDAIETKDDNTVYFVK